VPDVSIVIPTRDRYTLLLETLGSVRAQRGVDCEVLIVDDGSAAEASARVAALGDAGVRVLRSSESLGVSAARNRGIAASTGEWVAFLDDDDLWAPDKLARQLAAANHDGRDWAFSGSVSIDESRRVLSGGEPPGPERVVTLLPVRNCVPAGASNVLVRRRTLLDSGVFDTSLRHMSDWDLWIRLAGHGLPSVVASPDVAYRLHHNSASADTDEIESELALLAHRYATQRSGRPIDRAFVLRWAAWNRLRTGQRTQAVRAYSRAARAGDPLSALRAIAAVVDRDIVTRTLGRDRDADWCERASRWLVAHA
jgi:glycosyltransferase involved in cell wall biosynthesis